MTLLLPFLAVQLILILAAGWQATVGCVVMDALAALLWIAWGIQRLGLSGLLRHVSVRLDCAAYAVDALRPAYRDRRAAWAERGRG